MEKPGPRVKTSTVNCWEESDYKYAGRDQNSLKKQNTKHIIHWCCTDPLRSRLQHFEICGCKE